MTDNNKQKTGFKLVLYPCFESKETYIVYQ
ncbi:hypothetical protein HMPREF9944_00597 [Segatella maculosa OT 289]|uniref:Uncharacterized protein n=1 Tax=Segatella maculosa OT 289 TaxID=999422 RepID=H1HKA3_9BACT|nr:hypothetical protein HMPREF9944_00597 [Segatella maculosa OT 289]